jgi:hypothetical protein
VRVATRVVGRGSHAGRVERGQDAFPAFVAGDAVDDQRLGHERLDALLRIQRLVWILEHDLDASPVRAQPGHAPQRGDIGAVEHDPAGRLAGELDHDPPGRRLAAARLADEGEHLAPANGDVDPVDRTNDAAGPEEQRVAEATPDREVDLEPVEPE